MIAPKESHVLKLISTLFKTAHALRANDIQVQTVSNKILEHVLYYMNNGLVYGSESADAREMFASEMVHALSPVYDTTVSSNGATLFVPVDEGYYDNDYKYEYYLFYRDKNNHLGLKVLDAPPEGGYTRNSLLDDLISDVVVIHLTLASADNHCVSFSTYRVKQQTN